MFVIVAERLRRNGCCSAHLPHRSRRKVVAQEYFMTAYEERRDYGFVIGLLTGTAVGAGLAMLLAPRSGAELRHNITDSARSLGDRVSEQYRQASTRVGEAADEITRTVQDVRDEVADTVARGAHEVERYATAVKTDRVVETRKHAAADRSLSKPHSL
jgi:gas vesicle protein